jgi:hypothetical protein
MITYFNLKQGNQVETIDEISTDNFKTFTEFRKERKRMMQEYKIASSYYSGLYYSQRCANDWRQK